MAAALYRKRTYDFAKAIYVVGNEQSAHFKQLKAVLKEMGYNWSDDMTHVAFGLVTKNGKKLSTRKGNVILLEPTIAEAVNRAQAQIEAKNPNLPNKEAIAHAVGVGAIKFYDLKTDRMNGYDFDLDAMVSFEGETGPYVQYAHARIQSILRKADFTPSADATYSLNDVESWEIIKLLQDFHVSSTVHQTTLNHLSLLNLLSAWLKPLTNTMRTHVSWTKAQNVTAVWLFATQQQQSSKKPFAFSVLKLQTKCNLYLKRLRAFFSNQKKNPTHHVELFWRL